MQAGGHRFDPVHLHQFFGEARRMKRLREQSKTRRYRDTDGVTEVWEILRYSVVRLNDKMFDIVNREYEENGSFRCDFFRNERT